MEFMSDPIFMRAVERLSIVIASIFFGYLGFRLFILGATEGSTSIKAESKIVNIVFSGTAPGLFFMLVSGVVLVVALIQGGAGKTVETAAPSGGVSLQVNYIGDMKDGLQTSSTYNFYLGY